MSRLKCVCFHAAHRLQHNDMIRIVEIELDASIQVRLLFVTFLQTPIKSYSTGAKGGRETTTFDDKACDPHLIESD